MKDKTPPLSKPLYSIFKKPLYKNGKKIKGIVCTVRYLPWDGYFDVTKWQWVGWKEVKTKYTNKRVCEDEYARPTAKKAHLIRIGELPKPNFAVQAANSKPFFDPNLPIDWHQIRKRQEMKAKGQDVPDNKTHFEDYLEWGFRQGGKKGKPWAKSILGTKKNRTSWMFKEMGITHFPDISLTKLQLALEKKSHSQSCLDENKEVTGKLLHAYLDDVMACVNWFRRTFDIEEDPLKNARKLCVFDKSVTFPWRSMNAEEFGDLYVNASAKLNQLVYMTAVQTMFRVGGLEKLKVNNFSEKNQGIELDKSKDKEGQTRYKFIGTELTRQLAEFTKDLDPEDRLFKGYNFSKSWRKFHKDRKAANVPLLAFGGRCVFHSLKKTGVSFMRKLKVDYHLRMVMADHSVSNAHSTYEMPESEELIEVAEKLETYMLKAIAGAKSRKLENEKISGHTVDSFIDRKRGTA